MTEHAMVRSTHLPPSFYRSITALNELNSDHLPLTFTINLTAAEHEKRFTTITDWNSFRDIIINNI